MATGLYTVSPEDPISSVKEIIDLHQVHHVPVVEEDRIVGIISKSDLFYFLRSVDKESQETYINDLRLKNYKTKELMVKSVNTLASSDTIEKALEIFNKNQFHALPVVDNGILVGMITTHDIIANLLKEN